MANVPSADKFCSVGGAIGCNKTDEGPCVLMCLDADIYVTINRTGSKGANFSAFNNCSLSNVTSGANDTTPYVHLIFDDCNQTVATFDIK